MIYLKKLLETLHGTKIALLDDMTKKWGASVLGASNDAIEDGHSETEALWGALEVIDIADYEEMDRAGVLDDFVSDVQKRLHDLY